MRLIIDTENPIKIDVDNISVDDRVSLIKYINTIQIFIFQNLIHI